MKRFAIPVAVVACIVALGWVVHARFPRQQFRIQFEHSRQFSADGSGVARIVAAPADPFDWLQFLMLAVAVSYRRGWTHLAGRYSISS